MPTMCHGPSAGKTEPSPPSITTNVRFAATSGAISVRKAAWIGASVRPSSGLSQLRSRTGSGLEPTRKRSTAKGFGATKGRGTNASGRSMGSL